MDPSEHFAQVLVQSRRNPDMVADLQKILDENTCRHRHFAYNHRTLFESFISFTDNTHGVLIGDFYPQPSEYSIVFTQTSGNATARPRRSHHRPRDVPPPRTVPVQGRAHLPQQHRSRSARGGISAGHHAQPHHAHGQDRSTRPP